MSILFVIIPAVLGIMVFVLGLPNLKGNISTVPAIHRKRVEEKDKLAFGKQMGIGNMIMGTGFFGFGVAIYFERMLENPKLIYVAVGVAVAGLIIGLFISYRAMFKYNKGIF